MYYQNYEDYMRSVLGYPITRELYERNYSNCNYQDNKYLEQMYPQIYVILNPIVCEVCSKCNKPVNRETLEDMVNEVAQKAQVNNEISIKINIDNSVAKKEVIDNRNKVSSSKNIINDQTRKIQETQDRQRRLQNPLLNDLIRILILNQLLKEGFSQNSPRPPFPGGHGRPPFSNNPGMPPRPRDCNEYF